MDTEAISSADTKVTVNVREVKNAFKRCIYEWLTVVFEYLMRGDLTTDWCY